MTAPGVLWNLNSKAEDSEGSRQEKDGTWLGRNPTSIQGPKKANPLPFHCSVFQLHEYLLSTYYVLGVGGYPDKHI